MAFQRRNFTGNIGAGSNAPMVFTYGTGDNLADVEAAGYFGDKPLIDNVNFLMVIAEDGARIYSVSLDGTLHAITA